MCYGVFGFRPAGVMSGTAGAGATLDADGLNPGGHDGLTRVGSSAWLKVATSLTAIGAGDIGSAGMDAARYGSDRPCRITTSVSRVAPQELVARGVGADVRRSR